MTVKRWTANRRRDVIAELASEGLSGPAAAQAAQTRHGISPEEYAAWERQLQACGVHGLRAHRLRRVAKMERLQAKVDELCGAA
jgi:3-methyladenine DNA glycosylase/8-oxoguanine DNA glycosylase